MKLFDILIKGQTPILQKRKLRELITRERLSQDHPLRKLIPGETLTAKDQKRDDVLRAIADLSAYRDSQGIFMPALTLRHSLIEGARKGKIKVGRATIWKTLQGTMYLSPEQIPVLRSGERLANYDCLKDSLVRGTAGVVLQYQAQVSVPWEMRMRLLMLDDAVDDTVIEGIVRAAGLFAGVGSWISGGYGRYTLAECEPVKLPETDEEIVRLLQPA